MSTQVVKMAEVPKPSVMESVVMQGDLSKLSSEQRVEYMASVCHSMGLNPLTKPFEFITLNGKLTMYARKDCTDQLRSVKKVSVTIKARETIGDVYVVTANAKLPDGREDESTGAVPIANLKGENLANAFMKAETKAKRRVTLSICGLGLLDEAEVEAIPAADKGAKMYEQPVATDDPTDAQPDTTTYRLGFGKWRNRTLEQLYNDQAVGSNGIISYIDFLEESSGKSGKPMNPAAVEFIENATHFLGALENAQIKRLDAQQRGMDADE